MHSREYRVSVRLILMIGLVCAPSPFRYVRPQETGNKVGVRWIAVRSSADQVGVSAVGAGDTSTLSASALHLRWQDLDGGLEKGQTHAADVVERNETVLRVDWRQVGLGGVNSWGEGPLEPYNIGLARGHDISYSFWLTPFRWGHGDYGQGGGGDEGVEGEGQGRRRNRHDVDDDGDVAAATASSLASLPPCLRCHGGPLASKL